jgi:nicotinamide-nucleotide amidase
LVVLNDPVASLVAEVAAALGARGWMLATAESCTGGLIAARCTDRAGSSAWFDRGFVTYSNEAKTELLGVDEPTLAAEGAVSEAVARAMAAVAVTGIAGPSGAVPGKPVGTVWLGWAVRSMPQPAAPSGWAQGGAPQTFCTVGAQRLQLTGDRAAIRQATVQAALERVRALAMS